MMIADIVDFRQLAPLNTRDPLSLYPSKDLAAFGDKTVNPRSHNGQRYRAKLEQSIVERAGVEFETRSLPNLLVATLATLPSMSLIPSAPFADMFLRLSYVVSRL